MLVETQFVNKFKSRFFLIIPVQRFVKICISTSAGRRIVKIGVERLFNICRKDAFAHIWYEDMPELRFPFFAMWRHSFSEMYVREHMCQFVQQRNKEAVFIQCSIDTDTMIWLIG